MTRLPGNSANTLYPYEATTDYQVWKDFLEGSKSAYAYIYGHYFSSLYNYGYKFVQDRQFTEDCIQDVFLHILDHREHLSPTDSIKFYLFRALRNTIVKRLKKYGSQVALETGDETFHVAFSYEATWMENRIANERSQLLLNELNQLPSRQKEVIFLRFYDDLSYAEIAEVMGIEQTSVYKVIYKAIASLQKKVSLRNLFTLLILLHSLPE